MTPTPDGAEFSPEVLAFAADKGVTEYLPAVYEMTRRLFAGYPVQVVVRDDAERGNNREILFEVVVGDVDEDAMSQTVKQWAGEILRHCPDTHVHAFGIDPVVE